MINIIKYLLILLFIFLIVFFRYKKNYFKCLLKIVIFTLCTISLIFHTNYVKVTTEYHTYMDEPDISAGFGWVSAKYEVGGYNSWRISSGAGDYGGKSYGIPQFTSAGGGASINAFMDWLQSTAPAFAAPLTQYTRCSQAFDDAWTNLGKSKNNEFATYQLKYAYKVYTAPFIQNVKAKTGVDLARSWALLEMAHSTALQFGSGGAYALGSITSSMSDEQIIKYSYEHKRNNVNTYFRSSSASVRQGVFNRFIREEQDVLGLIGKKMDPSFIDILNQGDTAIGVTLKKPKVTDLDLKTTFTGDYKKGYLYSRFAKTLLAIDLDDEKRLDKKEDYIIKGIFKDAIDFEWANQNNSNVSNSSTSAASGDWATWRQGDSRWSGIPVGTGRSIGAIGCLATSVAIQIKRSGTATPNIPDFNPGTFVQYLNKHGGFLGAIFIWASPSSSGAAPNFKTEFSNRIMSGVEGTIAAKVKAELNRGCYMVMRVKYGTGMHWVAITDAGVNSVTMVDPASDETDVFKKYPAVAHRGAVEYSCFQKTD